MLDGPAMRRGWSTLLVSCAAVGLACLACLACTSGSSTNVNRDEACKDAYNHRGQVFFFIDRDAGDAGDGGADADAAPPCTVDCPGVYDAYDASFDSSVCEDACMQEAALERRREPTFVSCRQSDVSIGCTIEVLDPLPCDLQP